MSWSRRRLRFGCHGTTLRVRKTPLLPDSATIHSISEVLLRRVDTDIPNFDVHQNLHLFAPSADTREQVLCTASPGIYSLLDRYEYRPHPTMDLPVQPNRRVVGQDETGEVFYRRSAPENYHLSSDHLDHIRFCPCIIPHHHPLESPDRIADKNGPVLPDEPWSWVS